jgi:hypothetical protein
MLWEWLKFDGNQINIWPLLLNQSAIRSVQRWFEKVKIGAVFAVRSLSAHRFGVFAWATARVGGGHGHILNNPY